MKIMIHHYRYLRGDSILRPMSQIRAKGLTSRIDPRGGWTVAEIYSDDGDLLDDGDAKCSRLDNYNKKIGRWIAEGRALKRLNGGLHA
jgi:hypothetical protein